MNLIKIQLLLSELKFALLSENTTINNFEVQMTTGTKDKNAIPKRHEIDEKYRWKLTDIYKDNGAWEADFEKIQLLMTELKTFSGNLNNADSLFDCLEARSEMSRIMSCLFQYSKLNLDLDSRNSTFKEMVDRAMMLSSESSAAASFIEPELLKMSDEELLKLSLQFKEKDRYDFYIKELIRERNHVRSEDIEEILSMTTTFASGAEQTFSMLDDADITYPTIKDEDGNDLQLTKQRYAKCMDSSVRRVRKDANEGFYKPYKEHINTIASTLSSEVSKNIFYTKARKYNNTLHRALDGNNIPVTVYKSLLDTTEKHIEALHKWTSLRKKVLKLDEIAPFDMLCPLFPDYDYEVPYDEAVNKVIECCHPLGEDYNKRLVHAFGNRWVDVYETDGKTGGAYSWGNYSVHPYVLMNYNDTVDNMFTLAHELGHCLHSVYSNETQPFAKAQYSIFVAEVASTLNEGLLQQHLLKQAKTKEEKMYLLNRHIDNTLGTFFHQVMYARFELMIHQIVEKGGALSPDTLNKIWGDLTQKYYGPSLTMDDMTPLKWSRIPHFYMTFYVYQYATSYAASQAILKKFLDGEEGIIEKYLTLLKSGGRDYPINLLKECGVDMTTADPVLATIELFDQQVAELDKLTE
ncbi:MAG: oligoendopeptidase F [Calditrichaeota bacterium]|nr:MAG: oligoendopeptidase F [Calditrichota bacterium]